MFHIDGSQKSGSGTIVRTSVALAALLSKELYIDNIRAKRSNPGLRAQHLEAVRTCALLCGGTFEGAEVGSREVHFKPGGKIKGGFYERDIGTAGSTTMLASGLLPLTSFAHKPTTFRLIGGLFQDFAPSAHHMKHILLPTLKKMGVGAELEIERPGYVPTGGGIIKVSVKPVERIRPLVLLTQGKVVRIRGVALSSHLNERKVSERMAKECSKVLKSRGYELEISIVHDTTALQPGAALALWTETDTGCLIGMDQAGKPRRRAEDIGRYVAENLLKDLDSGATVDRYLADQLILYCALAEGESEYIIPKFTEHIETLLWLTEVMLGTKVEVKGNNLRVEGVGFLKENTTT
ncbi:MAG: RNA 3'-terminal phosphate cyclase [candidate division WS2 bacterium]|nr:RNA 3'-terminal phosphate cyclase [Candidatus Lithacetigena glycinireducens]